MLGFHDAPHTLEYARFALGSASAGSLNLGFRPPFSPLAAFGLALAIFAERHARDARWAESLAELAGFGGVRLLSLSSAARSTASRQRGSEE